MAVAVAAEEQVGEGGKPAEVWVLVDVKAKSATEVTLDLSSLPKGSTPIALRYAWDNHADSCCASS